MSTFDLDLPPNKDRVVIQAQPKIDRECPPADALLLGTSFCKVPLDKIEDQFLRYLYFRNGSLCVTAKYTYQSKVSGKWILAISQSEFPIAAATFFVDAVRRLRLRPSEPGAAQGFCICNQVNGEWLVAGRSMNVNFNDESGYTLINKSRKYGPTAYDDYMSLDMTDYWLFQGGLFELLQSISDRYLRGEFGPVTWRPAVP